MSKRKRKKTKPEKIDKERITSEDKARRFKEEGIILILFLLYFWVLVSLPYNLLRRDQHQKVEA